MKILVFTYFLVISVTYLPSAAFADATQMFPKDSPKNIFNMENAFIRTPKYKRESKDVTKQVAKTKEVKASLNTDQITRHEKANRIAKAKNPREAILKEFGDPNTPHPVSATEEMAPPFQGMIAALYQGDEELAFQYSKQYAQYMEDLKKVNKAFVGHQAKAMLDLGILPANSWASSSEFDEYNYLLDQDSEGKEQELLPDTGKLEEKAKKILAKAKQSRFDLFYDPEHGAKEYNEATERKAARALAKRIPLAKDGKIDIYFFLKSTQQESRDQGLQLQKALNNYAGDEKLNASGMTLGKENGSVLQVYRSETKAKFRITNGMKTAAMMNITRAPVIALVSKKTQRYYLIQEVKSSYFIDEIIKIMRGENA